MASEHFVLGAEVWLPDGDAINLGVAAYTPAGEALRAGSPRRYRYGEGLPGAAWASHRALVWKDSIADSQRPKAAPTPKHAAVGIPCFLAERLIGVVTLLVNAAHPASAALEVWQVSGVIDVMKFETGVYWHSNEFENLSRLLQFPRGTGLPGKTWQSEDCQFMLDVRRSSTFVRAELAERAGLKFGLAYPVNYDAAVVQALTWLSGTKDPLVIAYELLRPKPLSLASAVRIETITGAAELTPDVSKVFEMLASSVGLHGAPAVATHREGVAVALPVYDGLKLLSVACIAFA